MKKRYFYIAGALLLMGVLSFTIIRYKTRQHDEVYKLKDRTGAAAQGEEWKNVRVMATQLQNDVMLKPADTKSRLALVALFIQEARVTGDHMYYDKAAMKYVNDVLTMDSTNFEALLYKSLIYLSQHHFAEALATAQSAQKVNPYNAFIYGILVDAHVELGNYTQAVEQSDKMVSIRPDIRSYSRISYLREIHGDYPGAIEAMKMAVEAGVPGTEPTEWARIQLAHLYENTGDLRSAEMHYALALEQRPGYAYALAGMGRIARAAKEYGKAIRYYEQADTTLQDHAFKETLVDLYRLHGQKDKAVKVAAQLIDGMSEEAQSGVEDENIGHYADRELAYAYLQVNNYKKALEHALAEYNRRPANIDVNETVAWVYHHLKEYDKSLPYVKQALSTNSKNPTLLCRAGLIFMQAGDKAKAKTLLQEARKKKPNIDEDLYTESETAWRTLAS
jgi:tetratricopeptide (TPR) repeat protein